MSEEYFFHVKKERPEEIFNNVTEYYNDEQCREYASSKNMMRIQKKITIRALELLELNREDNLILDAGCGPGFASIYLRTLKYRIVALDLIPYFLKYYDLSEMNPISADMCWLPFKSNIFDAILSISALQWVYKEINNENMTQNLISLIKSFYYVLKPNSKAILQFYPKSSLIMDQIGKIIVNNSNFTGTYIIDNAKNPKKRKIFLKLEKGNK